MVGFWLSVLAVLFISIIFRIVSAKKELEKEDFYGEYVIDRNYFPGKQADWQYEKFKLEIKENDSLYFYVLEGGSVVKTFRGTITTVRPYNSDRLKIQMEAPTHHVLARNPTIYRTAWSFYLVFYSPRFQNVYFRKGRWKPLGGT
ncbi:hypothetical protein GCM10023184_28110 [Flaviaesturariibacter amylovorans]|uniref:Uncharacterized protein n=1 Tax=Flaviaesturariibacter amylovorans TaxID=1084520 RepID=A0ABP8H4K0_9BACT